MNGVVKDCDFHSLSIGIFTLKSERCEFNNNTLSELDTGIYQSQSLWMSTKGNEITKCSYGIHLYKMDYSGLVANNVDDTDYGILIGNSFEIQTKSNQITGSFFGLYFHDSSRCESLNDVISYSRFGLYCAYSQDCVVTSSELTRNKYGVSFLDVDSGVISSSRVKSNSDYGIHIKNSRDIEILSNTVFKNTGVGVYLVGVAGASVHNNEIGFNSGVNAADSIGGTVKALVNNWDTNAWSDFTGTSSYSISGDRRSLDNDPHYILYLESPSDIVQEAPANGVVIWPASAFRPNHFSIRVDGIIVEEGVWNGDNISIAFTGLHPDTYTYSLTLDTVSGISLSDTVIVNAIDSTPPEWVQVPQDQTIECGSPLAYQLQASDYYGIAMWWVNSTEFSITDGLLQNISSLEYGIYNLEVRAYDLYDNFVSYSISILVTDSFLPTVDSPEDIVFTEGEIGNVIIWNVYDCNPLSYEIYKDGTSIEFGEWTSGMIRIQYSLDTLYPGTYNFTLILIDIAGNLVSDSVQVHVETPSTTETPTETETPSTLTTGTSSESPSPTDGEMDGFDTVTLGLIGISACVVVVIILFLTKRK